jgi:hypothetical protein
MKSKIVKPQSMYWAAAGFSLIGVLAHEALGAPMVLPPLLETDLPPEVIWLHHFSWHVGSIAVAAMIAMFIYAACKPGNAPMAFIATAMSVGFALLGIGLAVFGNGVVWETPAPYVWALIAVIGGVGLYFEDVVET